MMNFNKVILMGRVTADPVLRVFDDGNKVVSFSIATNRTWKGSDNQKREEVCFVDCKAFGSRAQAINDFMDKGRPIFIEGHLHLDKWVDADSQKNMSRLRVVVDNFEFLDKKSDSEDAIPAALGNSFMSGSPEDYDAVVEDAIEAAAKE
jgi:single-strand DNA-binding protein